MGMVDIHCHILPGLDDGAKSWDVAVEMCRMAAADGTTHIVATPHANYHFDYDREKCLEALGHLRELTGDSVSFSLGCDFHFSYDNLQRLAAHRSHYTIGDSNYLLVELSDYAIPPRFGEHLRQMITSGIRPIITHPERNPLLQRRREWIVDWAAGGAIIQITANSLTGNWGKAAMSSARWLLDHNAVHVVASDGHDTIHRPPLLSLARALITEWKGPEVALALVESNPAAVVAGGDLPWSPLPEP
jgi:protein-tyrosine phosphatase